MNRQEVIEELLGVIEPKQLVHVAHIIADALETKIINYYNEFGNKSDRSFVKGLTEARAFMQNIESDVRRELHIEQRR